MKKEKEQREQRPTQQQTHENPKNKHTKIENRSKTLFVFFTHINCWLLLVVLELSNLQDKKVYEFIAYKEVVYLSLKLNRKKKKDFN